MQYNIYKYATKGATTISSFSGHVVPNVVVDAGAPYALSLQQVTIDVMLQMACLL